MQRADGSFDWHQHSRAQPLNGEPDVSSDEPHWSRIFTAMRNIAQAVASIDDLEPEGWQRKLGDDEWERAEALDGLGVARAILKECGKKGGRRLSERAFWWALRAEAIKICDLPMTLEQHKSGLRRDPKTGGLYLTIGLLRRLLRAIYVGRSGLLGSRAMDHLDGLLASSNGAPTGKLLYDTLPHCDEAMIFGPLAAARRPRPCRAAPFRSLSHLLPQLGPPRPRTLRSTINPPPSSASPLTLLNSTLAADTLSLADHHIN